MQNMPQPRWFDQLLEHLPEQVSFTLIIISGLLLAYIIWTYFPAEPRARTEIGNETNIVTNISTAEQTTSTPLSSQSINSLTTAR